MKALLIDLLVKHNKILLIELTRNELVETEEKKNAENPHNFINVCLHKCVAACGALSIAPTFRQTVDVHQHS